MDAVKLPSKSLIVWGLPDLLGGTRAVFSREPMTTLPRALFSGPCVKSSSLSSHWVVLPLARVVPPQISGALPVQLSSLSCTF